MRFLHISVSSNQTSFAKGTKLFFFYVASVFVFVYTLALEMTSPTSVNSRKIIVDQ